MMRFVPLGGYLGAGKTTTMLKAAGCLQLTGERVAVITNDQGTDLIDTQMARQQIATVGEVTGGCFCCRFEELADTIIRLRKESDPTVILAEAVGSCTDLQSTVVRPLRRYYGDAIDVSPLTVLVDPARYNSFARQWHADAIETNLAYLYRHQLDEADILALNKLDLLGSDETDRISEDMQQRFPHAHVVAVSAFKSIGLHELIRLWTGLESSPERRIDIDYVRYGTAEVELAWTNQVFELASDGHGKFVAVQWVDAFLASLAGACRFRQCAVGHIKVRVWTLAGTTKASLASDEGPPTFDEQHWIETDRATVTVNARVRCAPKDLEQLLGGAVAAASEPLGVRAEGNTGSVFSPGWPVPVHRL
jgi:Ni2+-binding GTPase involved in maturation of urease and hydrogenase